MATTVLLEIDWQGWIVELGHDPQAAEQARMLRAIARAHHWPVVCSRYLSLDPTDPLRADPLGAGASFVAGLGPQEEDGDEVLTKHGRDIFQIPTTAALLADLGAETVVLSGIATDGGVLLAVWGAHALGLDVAIATVSDWEPAS